MFVQRAIAMWVVLVGGIASASTLTNGPNGIDSVSLAVLGLDGTGVTVGQVEDIRPGSPAIDSPANHNDYINPNHVFLQDVAAFPPADMNLGVGLFFGHATKVAGVILSTDNSDPDMDGITPVGIAPAVSYEASAYVVGGVFGYDEAIETTQFLVRDRGIQILNHSWGKDIAVGYAADGNTLVTQGLDWIAFTDNVLNVVSGSQSGAVGVPADNFNGITVGMSALEGGTFRRVSSGNDYSLDMGMPRTFTDIIAPGEDVLLSSMGNSQVDGTGTSYATPLVTGTVALLNQYANLQEASSIPGWGESARRHEVMKAVIMNSADKIQDSGDGLRLGMTRDVVMTDGTSTWLDSDSYNPTSIYDPADQLPLDLQLGAGHLNAKRAYHQFSAGETNTTQPTIPEASTIVPQVGWDWSNTGETGLYYNNYEFGDELPENSFVSITLIWDRQLTLATDGGVTGAFDAGDDFEIAGDFDEGFNDLNLYLLPEGASDINEAVAQSIATGWNVEHIFWQIPTTGRYEFWVFEADSPLGLDTDYAVAWWAYEGPPGSNMNGDFNGDLIVDAEDYTLWKSTFGNSVTPGMGADGNGDGVVNLADYTVWRDNLGATSALSTHSVPEPSSLLCLLLLFGCRPRLLFSSRHF